MTHAPRLLLVVPLALVLAACTSNQRAFEGVGPGGESARVVRYRLTANEQDVGSIALEARGRAGDEHEGVVTDTLRVNVTVDNLSDDAIELPLDSFEAHDDAGRNWGLAELSAPAIEGDGDLLIVPGGQRTTVGFLFDSGAEGALETTGSVTLSWMYATRGARLEKSTRFIPAPRTVYRDVHYGPAWGWGWGGGWGYRRGPWVW